MVVHQTKLFDSPAVVSTMVQGTALYNFVSYELGILEAVSRGLHMLDAYCVVALPERVAVDPSL